MMLTLVIDHRCVCSELNGTSVNGSLAMPETLNRKHEPQNDKSYSKQRTPQQAGQGDREAIPHGMQHGGTDSSGTGIHAGMQAVDKNKTTPSHPPSLSTPTCPIPTHHPPSSIPPCEPQTKEVIRTIQVLPKKNWRTAKRYPVGSA
jgi:hypothetical protein